MTRPSPNQASSDGVTSAQQRNDGSSTSSSHCCASAHRPGSSSSAEGECACAHDSVCLSWSSHGELRPSCQLSQAETTQLMDRVWMRSTHLCTNRLGTFVTRTCQAAMSTLELSLQYIKKAVHQELRVQ